MGDRKPVFHWIEVEDTNFWFDYESNSIVCDLGLSIICDSYTQMWDCIWDLYESIIEHYKQLGIAITYKEYD